MSEKNAELESLKMEQEQLDQVVGGAVDDEPTFPIIVKPRCPNCRSNRYYSYILIVMGEKYTVYNCPECGYIRREKY